MNQEVSKQKKNAKWLKAYIVSVHIVLFVMVLALVVLVHEQHALTQDQIKKIAVSYSLADCNRKSEGEPGLDCGGIVLDDPIEYDWEYPYWGVKYHTTKGESFSNTIYVNRFGESISNI